MHPFVNSDIITCVMTSNATWLLEVRHFELSDNDC